MRKLKALFVHDHRFSVAPSGDVFSPGKLSYTLWQQYLDGFDELVIVGRTRPGKEESSDSMNISSGENVSFVFVPNIAQPWGLIRYGLQVKKKLKQQIQSVDAVIARTSLLGYLAASLAEQLGKPLAAEVVGCPWDAVWNYGTINGRFTAPLYYMWQRRMVNRAPFAIYVTQEFLQRRYPCRGITAGVSDVNVPLIDAASINQRFQRVQQPRQPFVFGLIGSLQSKWKGIQTALAALRAVYRKMPKFELQVLGDGDPTYWIRLATSYDLGEVVRFMGTLPSGRLVLKWLDDVDVYLQPSFQEGLPRSLVEAMSRGCPAIGSTAGGIPELLDSAVLHQPGNATHLSALLMKSMDADWRATQAKRNLETAKLYVSDVLDARRGGFWRMFMEYVSRHKSAMS